MTKHQVVSKEQWLEARRAFLAKEKQLTRQHDQLADRPRERDHEPSMTPPS